MQAVLHTAREAGRKHLQDNATSPTHQSAFVCKSCPSAVTSLGCTREEFSWRAMTFNPCKWYSRNFGLRRGRFFYHRIFVFEIIEWSVQFATLQSLMSRKHVVYTQLALAIVLFNVCTSSRLFFGSKKRDSRVALCLIHSQTYVPQPVSVVRAI